MRSSHGLLVNIRTLHFLLTLTMVVAAAMPSSVSPMSSPVTISFGANGFITLTSSSGIHSDVRLLGDGDVFRQCVDDCMGDVLGQRGLLGDELGHLWRAGLPVVTVHSWMLKMAPIF